MHLGKKLHKTKTSYFEVPYNFYAPSPNSNFLFSEPEITGLFPEFPGALGPSGLRLGKKLHKIKTCYFEVPYNFAFMDQVRIPTFYLANL